MLWRSLKLNLNDDKNSIVRIDSNAFGYKPQNLLSRTFYGAKSQKCCSAEIFKELSLGITFDLTYVNNGI